jgi:hypothetical protein
LEQSGLLGAARTAWDAKYRLDANLLESLEKVVANLDLRHGRRVLMVVMDVKLLSVQTCLCLENERGNGI